jgi:hypothetical protein
MSSDSSTAAAVQLPEPQGMFAVAHSKLAAFRQWQQANIGLQLIAASQLFFSGQTLCVKILQDENGMPVMQIVFVRMVSGNAMLRSPGVDGRRRSMSRTTV